MKERLDRADFAKRRVDWVFLEIRDLAPQVEQVVTTASRVADEYGADYRMLGSQILMTRGTVPFESSGEIKPRELVDELSRTLGSAAKILYGSMIAPCGFLAGRGLHFALLPPYLTEARHQVGALDWGEVVEFETKNV